jgi:phenylacetate-CoA ligase
MAASPIAQFSAEARQSGFWNRHTETLARAELEAMHLAKLRKLLAYARANSPFYRRRFDQAKLDPEAIKSLDDFKKRVPLLDKSDFLHLQKESPPYGPTLAVAEEMVVHHCETSGTTGVPLAIPYTMYDTERYGESWVYGMWAQGIRPEDSCYFAFNWGNFAGFWSCYWGIRRLGCRLLSGGGADTKGHIENILRMEPTVLVSTPTFALRLAHVAKEMGVDIAQSSIRFTYHAGEPGPFALPAMQRALDEAWGAESGELLGIAEVDAFAPGCPRRDGVHVNEMNVFCWSRDPLSGEETPEGEIGENIITSYVNSAQPLINYHTHDLVRRRESCACGRTWTKFEGVVLGRTDYMMTVRGTNVYPTAVENLLGEAEGVSPYFQLVLSRVDANDRMTVEFEPEAGIDEGRWAALAAAVGERIHHELHVRLEVTPVPPESLPRYELKTRRVIDNRPKELQRELDR